MSTKEEYRGDDTKIPKNARIVVQRVPSTYGVLARMRGGEAKAPTSTSAATTDEFGGDVFNNAPAETDGGLALKLAEIAEKRAHAATHHLKYSNFHNNSSAAGTGFNNASSQGVLFVANNNNKRSSNAANATSQFQKQLVDHQQRGRRVNIGIPKNFLGGANTESEEQEVSSSASGWMKYKSDDTAFDQKVKAHNQKLSDDEVRNRIDISNIPSNLLCALSNKILRDAVVLPCCKKSCSSEELERTLVSKQFKCPLCNTANITIDKLTPDIVLRKTVSSFIQEQRTKLESNEQLNEERAAVQEERMKEEQRQREMNLKNNRPDDILDLGASTTPHLPQVVEEAVVAEQVINDVAPPDAPPAAAAVWKPQSWGASSNISYKYQPPSSYTENQQNKRAKR